MPIPLQITFRAVPQSDAIVARIQHYVDKLEAHAGSVSRCHVTVDQPHRHHAHGGHFSVRISLSVPGREIVVTRDPTERHAREDFYPTLDEAFADAMRLVENHVKQHASHRAPRRGALSPR